MVVIMSSENGCPCYCYECGALVGTLDYGEWCYFEETEGGKILCFSCEGSKADYMPIDLVFQRSGDELVIDDCLFVLATNWLDYLLLARGPHVRERAHAASLSSSTYLNSNKYLIIPGWIVGVGGEK